MMAMMMLAVTPAGDLAMRLKAIQQMDARAAKMKPSFLWMPRRYIERNMKMAAAQSRPKYRSRARKLKIDSGMGEGRGEGEGSKARKPQSSK